MPTGYTADVQSGEITEFQQFAIQCARAFGALIMMRDEPMDAPIPEEFKPNDTYDRWTEEALADLLRYETMTLEEASKAARDEYDAEVAAREERKQRRAAHRHRYEAMLAQVNEWNPPSAEHIEFKRFMASQLTESIDLDCNDTYDVYPKFQGGEAWRTSKITDARKRVDRYKAEYAKELDRTAGRNRWVRQLRDSLAPSQATAAGADKNSDSDPA